ncbi:cation:proton antiporter [Saccharospirillum salsuginis]|uniref:Potassium efflux system protein n=1 Tax=Saccharospirillum salsuginis TaxID=418750 RepID=A0A918K667_9GAMM|nr:cation:proton antiporter [Saccharospirillum salsuginis]GGX48925.1 potassium efflux system protein [Saccharospirillum salsuginis]
MLELIHTNPFYELTALLALAAVLGLIGQRLRQPMVVTFIAVGILAGPSVLGLVRDTEYIQLLAELGIAVLLFLVGLKLDLTLIRTLGRVAVATGLGQVVFTSLVGFALSLLLGLDAVTAAYIAIALTFSSTIIIVKLLSDKREVDSLHGKIAIGFLIVQDVVVVLAMIALSALGMGAGDDSGQTVPDRLIGIGLGALVMVAVVGVFIRWLANPLMKRVAASSELLLVFGLGLASLMAAIGHRLGFSMELGGLLAGVALASTPYREAIVSRMSSLRDFLLLFFFIALGSELDLHLLGAQVIPALVLSAFVLIGNPLIVMIIMGFMGYGKRTGFLAGLTVAQISEFSLVFIAMGLTLGHVGTEALGLVTLVGLITIVISVYMITYSHTLYRWLEPYLGAFERRGQSDSNPEEPHPMSRHYDAIIYGYGRFGSEIGWQLQTQGLKLAVVDFNPEVVQMCRENGMEAFYGDACDPDFIGYLPLSHTDWIISTVRGSDTSLTHEDPRLVLLNALRQHDYRGRVAVTTHRPSEVDALTREGVDLVFLPFRDAADQAARLILQADRNAPR